MTKLRILFGLLLLVCSSGAIAGIQDVIKKLRVPKGFTVSLYADRLPNARSMTLGDNGVVFVGTGKEGKVYAVLPPDAKGDKAIRLIASGLNMPNGVAYKDGALYVAEISRILRYDAITTRLDNPPTPVVIFDRFPTDKHHGWKYLRFGPDNKLYTAVGAPCNICKPNKAIYTSLVRLNPDGSQFELLADGIRNTVGFDWQPETKRLFFSENGRDFLGDDLPPDELNEWSAKGEDFGYPHCHGGNIPDPEFAEGRSCREFKAPAWKFKSHVAPLGMRFYTGNQFPAEYKNQLFVAQHGSWNRTIPQGYRVVLVKFNKAGKAVAEQSFISGWLAKNGSVSGRPVDILALPDGSLLVSDDAQGVIYRVSYQAAL